MPENLGSLGRLSVEVVGTTDKLESQLQQVERKAQRTGAAMERLRAIHGEGKLGSERYAESVRLLGDRMQAAQAKADQLRSAIARQGGAAGAAATATSRLHVGMAGIRGAGQNGAMGLLQLSNAIDDVQYGFRGVVNNIPGILMGFGAGMGIAGAAQIAAVGVNVLVQHWDDLTDALGVGAVRTEAEQMEKLEKATSRTAEETARLAKYKREQAALESAGGPTRGQAAADAQAVEMVRDMGRPGASGRDLLIKQMTESRIADQGGVEASLTAEEQKRLHRIELDRRRYEKWGLGGAYVLASGLSGEQYFAKKKQEVLDQANDRARKEAERRLGKALTDPAARESLVGEIRRNPGRFAPGLDTQLEDTIPADDPVTQSNERYKKSRLRKRYQQLAAEAAREKKEKAKQDEIDEAANEAFDERMRDEQHAGEARARRAAELARPMQDRLAERALGGREVSAETIAAGLRGQGLSRADADEMAGLMFRDFAEHLRDAVRKRMAETGETMDEASAAMLRDLRHARFQRARQEMDQAGVGKFTGLAEFHRELQVKGMAAAFADRDPGRLIDLQMSAARELKEAGAQLKKVQQAAGFAVGPAD